MTILFKIILYIYLVIIHVMGFLILICVLCFISQVVISCFRFIKMFFFFNHQMCIRVFPLVVYFTTYSLCQEDTSKIGLDVLKESFSEPSILVIGVSVVLCVSLVSYFFSKPSHSVAALKPDTSVLDTLKKEYLQEYDIRSKSVKLAFSELDSAELKVDTLSRDLEEYKKIQKQLAEEISVSQNELGGLKRLVFDTKMDKEEALTKALEIDVELDSLRSSSLEMMQVISDFTDLLDKAKVEEEVCFVKCNSIISDNQAFQKFYQDVFIESGFSFDGLPVFDISFNPLNSLELLNKLGGFGSVGVKESDSIGWIDWFLSFFGI